MLLQDEIAILCHATARRSCLHILTHKFHNARRPTACETYTHGTHFYQALQSYRTAYPQGRLLPCRCVRRQGRRFGGASLCGCTYRRLDLLVTFRSSEKSQKKIRSTWNEEEGQWYFSVVDVVEALTDSNDPKQYIKKMRSRDEALNIN